MLDTTPTTPVFALWHGGSGYALGYIDDDVERFETREDALDALRTRYEDGDRYSQDFHYIARSATSVFTPGVGLDSSMTFWDVDPRGSEDFHSDDVVTLEDFLTDVAS